MITITIPEFVVGFIVGLIIVNIVLQIWALMLKIKLRKRD